MADKWTAINTFWNGFGLKAYDENTVPGNAVMPYITYSASISMLDEPVYMSASIWFRSNSWTEVSQKAEEISNYIGGGAGVAYDGGRMWVTKASPFAQRMAEPNDLQVRRIIIQITADFQ